MSDNLPADLKKLFAFYIEQRKNPPKDYAIAQGLIPSPSFFTVAKLQEHLNNPLLRPEWVQLRFQQEIFKLESDMLFKMVQHKELHFLNKDKINDVLSRGGSVILEGLDILEPVINTFLAKVDAAMPCALSNSVAFFSQKDNEAYRGHRDTDDVLVIHLSGEKRWRIFAPQQRRYFGNFPLTEAQMGEQIAEFVMQPGDALFMRAGVPHIVNTTGDHSLHLAFDLIDRTPNIENITHAANERYNHGGENPHVSPSQVADYYIGILQDPNFRRELEVMTEDTRASAVKFRERVVSTSSVRALSKYISKTKN
ncbi:MAG: cupin domain-containing protein [Gammaproteobacteria bacterium]|jgi:hypothetical protein